MSEAALCHADAKEISARVANYLKPFCDRLSVAGSVRRGEAVCNDVELVCVPRMVPAEGKSLFADPEPQLVSALDRFANALSQTAGDLILDPNTKRNGPRYKRFLACGVMPIDLFIVQPPAEWGALLAIRTGDAEFARLLVTKRKFGGAMPDDVDQRDGALWRGLTKIPTPTEEDYFRVLGLDPIHPARRSVTTLRRILAQR